MSARDPAGDTEREPQSIRQDDAPERAVRPSLGELMLAFGKVSLIGFGGVLPWWRRMLVE